MNELVRVMLAASAWGVRQAIEACDTLTPEQFAAAHGIGPPPGSLKETLAHTVDAMFYFADNFGGREYRERPHFVAGMHTPHGLLALLAEAEAELQGAVDDFLRRAGQGAMAPVHWSFMQRDIPFAVALAQVLDHATHHRVQCMHMLKRSGLESVPEAFPLEWQACQ